MASPRGGRSWQPAGVARALVRLLVLIVVGFAVGLVFGVVTEEPELLAGHLRGDGESVAVGDVDPDASDPSGEPARGESPAAGASVAAAPANRESAVYASAATGIEPPRQDTRPRPVAREEAAEPPRPPVAAARPSARGESLRPAPSAPVPSRAVPVSASAAASGAGAASGGEPAWSIQVGAFSEQGTADRVAASLKDRYPVTVLPANSKGGRWRVRVQPIAGEDRAREIADRLKRDEQLPTWVTRMEASSAP